MNYSVTHKFKYKILRTIQISLEKLGLVSKSSSIAGTFDGEEFIFYSNYFQGFVGEMRVLDIGANTGLWALDFIACIGSENIRIFAIEPIPEFFELITSLKHNKIFPINIAIGIDGGITRLAKVGNGATSFPNLDNQYPISKKILNWHEVRTISGDSLVREFSLAPHLIKIDTDGYDFEVLKSLISTLNVYRPLVQFEFTFRFARKANYSLREVLIFLKKCKYRIYVLTPNGKLRKILFGRLEVLNHQTKNFIAIPY